MVADKGLEPLRLFRSSVFKTDAAAITPICHNRYFLPDSSKRNNLQAGTVSGRLSVKVMFAIATCPYSVYG